jgi:hypothetical protein
MSCRIKHIEFIGGPYDGHVQPFGESGLIRCLSLPVTENMLPLLRGAKLERTSPINSLARYILRCVDGSWQYEFIELTSLKDFDLRAMREAGRKALQEHKKTTRNRRPPANE